jgi:hypothetical protein
MLQELIVVHPHILDRYAEDRAQQLRQLAAAYRVSDTEPLLPTLRHAAGRMLVGIGQRLLSDAHGPVRRPLSNPAGHIGLL